MVKKVLVVVLIGLGLFSFTSLFASGKADFLIQIERLNINDKDLLIEKDLKIVHETLSSLYLIGDKEDISALQKYGYNTQIIDSSPEQFRYYSIGLRKDSDIQKIKEAGDIVFSEENIVILRVPVGVELKDLYDAKVFISPITFDGFKKPLYRDEIEKKLTSRNEATNPLVVKMINALSMTQVDNTWNTIVVNSPSGTRNSTSTGCFDASNYVLGQFSNFGLQTRSLTHTSGYAPNTEGQITGALKPDEIYIIEGHLDDAPSTGLAPGADDNASGSVAVVESARVLSCWAFKKTVRFLTVTGEEQGLFGSTDYANDAYNAGENIQGVLNYDMPGWEGDGTPNPENLDVNYDANSQSFGEYFAQTATNYSTGLVVDAFLCPSLNASDHYQFWVKGYKALCGITDNEGYCGHEGEYPYYHTANDIIANCGDKTFFHSVVKTSVAAIAELGEPFKITFDKNSYACNSQVQIIVGDKDLNTNPSTQQTVNVTIWSNLETVPETVTLTEDGTNSMIFKGTINLTTNPPANGDGYLSVGNGSTITAKYTDAVDCDGSTNVEYTCNATACTPPVISNVTITNVTASSATINWITNILANSRVSYGNSKPPETNQDDLTNYVTNHSITLSNLSSCQTYYFSVTSTDEGGNSATDTNGGNYYSFTTQGASYALTPQTFESGSTGWTLTGQWHQDNCKAHGGSYAMKAGAALGTCPGQYNASTTSDMTTSSSINLGSTGHGYHLRFWEYYQTESGWDYCRVQISTNGTTFTNLVDQYAGSGTTWTQRDIDLSAYTGNIWIRFEFYADSVYNYEGWYIDDVEISKSQGCSAELIYQSRTVNDACNGTGSGGGNGLLEPGEDATIQITMLNNGMQNATGVSATLSCSTSGVTVTDSYATYPDIASGATGASQTNHYTVHVDSSVTCATTANFTLHSTSNENPTGTDSYFTINIGQAGGTVTDFSENFNGVTTPNLPSGWTRSKTSGNDWATNSSGCTGNALYYPYNSSQAANSWAYTPAIALTSGVTYTLGFNQKIYSSSYPEKMEIKCGTSATPAGQTITIMSVQTYTNTTCTARSYTFTVPTSGNYYIGFHCTSAANMWNLYVDDVVVTHASTPICNVCTSSCTNPSAPSITNITDNNECAQSGITITFTSGTPATRHDLYKDGAVAQSSVTSPISYNPGDASSHSYKIRAINSSESCYNESDAVSGTDANGTPSQPVITSIVDIDPNNLTGIQVNYTSGTPATRHDLYKDGSLAVSSYVSGATYQPGDSSTHSYVVKAINGTCTTDSAAVNGTDAYTEDTPSEVPPIEPADKNTLSWSVVPGATGYRVYRGTKDNLAALCDSTADFCTAQDSASTSYSLTGDTPADTYKCFYYLVTAYNASGEGSAGTATCGTRTVNTTGICTP